MAAHLRRTIREGFVAMLAGAGTAAGSRVFDHPYDPRTVFPALSVIDVSEDQRATTLPGGPSRTIERRLVLEVAAEVRQIADYARARDDLLADVEAAAASWTFPGVKSITPVGYAPDADVSMDKPVAVGRQRFEIFYVTTQGTPSSYL